MSSSSSSSKCEQPRRQQNNGVTVKNSGFIKSDDDDDLPSSARTQQTQQYISGGINQSFLQDSILASNRSALSTAGADDSMGTNNNNNKSTRDEGNSSSKNVTNSNGRSHNHTHRSPNHGHHHHYHPNPSTGKRFVNDFAEDMSSRSGVAMNDDDQGTSNNTHININRRPDSSLSGGAIMSGAYDANNNNNNNNNNDNELFPITKQQQKQKPRNQNVFSTLAPPEVNDTLNQNSISNSITNYANANHHAHSLSRRRKSSTSMGDSISSGTSTSNNNNSHHVGVFIKSTDDQQQDDGGVVNFLGMTTDDGNDFSGIIAPRNHLQGTLGESGIGSFHGGVVMSRSVHNESETDTNRPQRIHATLKQSDEDHQNSHRKNKYNHDHHHPENYNHTVDDDDSEHKKQDHEDDSTNPYRFTNTTSNKKLKEEEEKQKRLLEEEEERLQREEEALKQKRKHGGRRRGKRRGSSDEEDDADFLEYQKMYHEQKKHLHEVQSKQKKVIGAPDSNSNVAATVLTQIQEKFLKQQEEQKQQKIQSKNNNNKGTTRMITITTNDNNNNNKRTTDNKKSKLDDNYFDSLAGSTCLFQNNDSRESGKLINSRTNSTIRSKASSRNVHVAKDDDEEDRHNNKNQYHQHKPNNNKYQQAKFGQVRRGINDSSDDDDDDSPVIRGGSTAKNNSKPPRNSNRDSRADLFPSTLNLERRYSHSQASNFDTSDSAPIINNNNSANMLFGSENQSMNSSRKLGGSGRLDKQNHRRSLPQSSQHNRNQNNNIYDTDDFTDADKRTRATINEENILSSGNFLRHGGPNNNINNTTNSKTTSNNTTKNARGSLNMMNNFDNTNTGSQFGSTVFPTMESEIVAGYAGQGGVVLSRAENRQAIKNNNKGKIDHHQHHWPQQAHQHDEDILAFSLGSNPETSGNKHKKSEGSSSYENTSNAFKKLEIVNSIIDSKHQKQQHISSNNSTPTSSIPSSVNNSNRPHEEDEQKEKERNRENIHIYRQQQQEKQQQQQIRSLIDDSDHQKSETFARESQERSQLQGQYRDEYETALTKQRQREKREHDDKMQKREELVKKESEKRHLLCNRESEDFYDLKQRKKEDLEEIQEIIRLLEKQRQQQKEKERKLERQRLLRQQQEEQEAQNEQERKRLVDDEKRRRDELEREMKRQFDVQIERRRQEALKIKRVEEETNRQILRAQQQERQKLEQDKKKELAAAASMTPKTAPKSQLTFDEDFSRSSGNTNHHRSVQQRSVSINEEDSRNENNTDSEQKSNNNNNNNITTTNASPILNSNDHMNDRDFEQAERGSYFGTNTSGSGDEGDDASPLQHVLVDMLWKNDKSRIESTNVSPENKRDMMSSMGLLNDEESGLSSQSGSQQSNQQHKHKFSQKTFLRYLRSARRQEETIFSQLDLKSSRGLLICDPGAADILWANEAAARIFGRLDLVGSKLETLMPAAIGDRHAGVVAAYRDRYHANYKKNGTDCDSRLLDLVKPRRLVVICRRAGRDVETHIDGWVRTLRLPEESHEDMPRLMALECYEAENYHQDAQTARIFSSALDNVSDAVVIANFDGQLHYINKAAELLSGYPLAALKAIRATVNIFLPNEFVAQHEGYLQHFRQARKASATSMDANSHETVVSRRVEMKTAFGREEILLRVDVAYDKLIAYLKSTKEFIPREDFANERLKLLLPSSIVKLLRGATNVSDITSYFWEFDNRTVMFTDVAGFSNWAKNRPVKAVHDRMQPMFSEFEAIIQAFGGELIHRIGDAVMVIFGFNGEERHHARYALGCAVELQQWSLSNGFMIRIGLHSGSIGAGIYGSDKGRPSFDAWGPVVNIAKRLEAYGEEGNVHISKHVRDALGHRFANQLHMILRETVLEGIKGIEDGECSYILPVKAPESSQVSLPEKFLQLVGFQRAKYARWRIANEETERRLAELQKASR